MKGRKTVRVKGTGSVRFCTFCGSMSPDRPGPNCAHGRTAVASGESVRVAARLWLALQSVDGYRRELATVLDAEIRSGLATVDPCPPVRCTGNVVFLQDREVHSEEQPVRVG